MPSINEVLERCAGVRPDPYSDEDKARWLIGLEGRIYKELMKSAPPNPYPDDPPRKYPEDGDKPLLAGAPYDRLYDYYLFAMADFHSSEADGYNNDMTLFNAAYSEFAGAYRRANTPERTKEFVV